MPELVSSAQANALAAAALYASGKSTREVAAELGITQTSAWRLRHVSVDPELVQHCSKTITDRLLISASGCTDELLERALDGRLKAESGPALAKMASSLVETAREYALTTGAKDMMSELLSTYGVEPSHSVSRITVQKSVTLETSQPQPVVISPLENNGK